MSPEPTNIELSSSPSAIWDLVGIFQTLGGIRLGCQSEKPTVSRKICSIKTIDINYHRLLAFSFLYHSFEQCACLSCFEQGKMQYFSKLLKNVGKRCAVEEKSKCYTNICLLSEYHQGSPRLWVFFGCWPFLKYSTIVLFGGGCWVVGEMLAAVLITFRYQISCYSSDCAYFICIYKVCFGIPFVI